MKNLLELQIKNLEFLIDEAVRLGKKPERVIEIWRQASEEDEAARGSGLHIKFAENYNEFMKARMDYQLLKVQLYLYHGERPSLS